MEPRKITREVTYTKTGWTCHNPKHLHTTQLNATECIRKASAPRRVKRTPEAIEEMASMRANGNTFAAIGASFSICGQRVAELLRKRDRIARGREAIVSYADSIADS